MVVLKRDHGLGANTVLHNAVIIAQFLKRQGRSGITRELQLPERITSLPKEYREEDLARFFNACYDVERALFSTFLLTGFREQEVMYLIWSDVNLDLRAIRVTAKPQLGFYPSVGRKGKSQPRLNWSNSSGDIPGGQSARLCFHRRQAIANSICSIVRKRSPSGVVWIRQSSIRRRSAPRMPRVCCAQASMFEQSNTGWATSRWRRRCVIWYPRRKYMPSSTK